MRLLFPVLVALYVSLGNLSAARSEQPNTGEAHRTALSLGHEALQLFARGDFSAARDRFERADGLAHSPVFVLYQARAERKLGHLLRARQLFERCAEESVTSASPDAWRKAVADAVVELEELSTTIPRVRFVITGGAVRPVRIEGNGRELSLTEPESSVAFDPGHLRITAEDASGLRLTLETFLTQGEQQRIELAFPSVQRGPSSPRASVTESGWNADSSSPVRPYRSGAHAAFLLGGSAFLFSVLATTVAVAKAESVKAHCREGRCRPEDQVKAQSAVRWANLATAGVVVGATGVVTGVGLLLVPGNGKAGVAITGRF